jgi:hypothetical protein
MIIRMHLVLAFGALMLSAVLELPQPLSVPGWLIDCQDGAFAAWSGLTYLLLISGTSKRRIPEGGVASRFWQPSCR